MKQEKNKLIELIDKLLNGEGTDAEQEEWVNKIRESAPFYEKIVNYIFWSNEELTAEEIYEKAKSQHKHISL